MAKPGSRLLEEPLIGVLELQHSTGKAPVRGRREVRGEGAGKGRLEIAHAR